MPAIEKLRGRENYLSWKIAMEACLQYEDLWGCVQGLEEFISDARKVTKARSHILVAVESVNYIHVQDITTAKDTWKRLQTAFEDSRLTRRVSLLKTLISTQLRNCDTVEKYVNIIISTAHQLRGIGMQVSDEWIGVILLAGLPNEYRPMIMGLESSGLQITADLMKTKLLQKVQNVEHSSHENAFFSKRKKKKEIKCYKCNVKGHFANKCPDKSAKATTKPKTNEGKTEDKEKAFSAFLLSHRSRGSKWYVDSCASAHITSVRDNLQTIREHINANIMAANQGNMRTESIGDVKLYVKTENGKEEITAKDVIYGPESAVNLLSVSKLVEKGLSAHFTPKENNIEDSSGNKMASMVNDDGIFKLETSKDKAYFAATTQTAELWHRRLGHLGYKSMKALSDGLATGIQVKTSNTTPCISCIKEKHHRASFPKEGKRATEMLELIHSNLCGPMETTSAGGSRYFLTLIDDFTRKVFIFFLKEKSEVAEIFEEFRAYVERQTKKKIRILRSLYRIKRI